MVLKRLFALAAALMLATGLTGAGRAEGIELDIPDLTAPYKPHWIFGADIYYVSGKAVVKHGLEDNSKISMPYGNYEVRGLIARHDGVFLTARVLDPPEFDQSIPLRGDTYYKNAVFAGIHCRLDTLTCNEILRHKGLITNFQSYRSGYVYGLTDWAKYNDWADIRGPVESDLVIRDGNGKERRYAPGFGLPGVYVSLEEELFVDAYGLERKKKKYPSSVFRFDNGNFVNLEFKGSAEYFATDFKNYQYFQTNGTILLYTMIYYIVRPKLIFHNYFCCNSDGRFMELLDKNSGTFFSEDGFAYIESKHFLVNHVNK